MSKEKWKGWEPYPDCHVAESPVESEVGFHNSRLSKK